MLWIVFVLCISLARALPYPVPDSPPDYDWDTITPLDEYVWREDGFYEWVLLDQFRYNETVTSYVLNVTSHKYMYEEYVDCSVWWHLMSIAIPDEPISNDTALMLINGGSNRYDGNYPGEDDLENVGTAIVSELTGLVTAVVSQIPNQPCYFMNDPDYKRRSEDSIIAWTWRTFSDWNRNNSDVVLRLPMTKGAKRGLDAIHDLCLDMMPGSNIDKFYVIGTSKRGWTTWSLAAVDPRVKAIIPIVFDLLNMPETMMHHFQALDGAYSFALEPYYNENLTQELLLPESEALFDLEDMIRYRSRLTMPKYLMVGSQDEFFLTTDTHYWWDLMPEPKQLFVCANGNHGMVTCWIQIGQGVVGYFLSVFNEIPLPKITWTLHETENGESGHVIMHTTPPPSRQVMDLQCNKPFPDEYKVRGWRSPTVGQQVGHGRRDWRLAHGYPEQEEHGVSWTCVNETIVFMGIEEDEEGNEVATFRYDTDGEEGEWVGHFIEFEYAGPMNYPVTYTTEVNVIPNTLPHEPCDSAETCYGYLV